MFEFMFSYCISLELDKEASLIRLIYWFERKVDLGQKAKGT